MLWFDLLRTPMAAPETPSLRRMRYLFQAFCFLSAASVGTLSTIQDVFGRRGTIAILILLAATSVHGIVYLVRKNAADSRWLDQAQSTELSS